MIKTFMELYREGVVKKEDIDKYIEIWHNDKKNYDPLHIYLGMTFEEYKKFVEKDKL